MRNDALNTNVKQLIYLHRIVVQDGEGQQGGIRCRVVHLKNETGKERLIYLIIPDLTHCLLSHLVNVFNGHTGDAIHQGRAQVNYLG